MVLSLSDRYITDHTGFLNRILPGDLILAVRAVDAFYWIGPNQSDLKVRS